MPKMDTKCYRDPRICAIRARPRTAAQPGWEWQFLPGPLTDDGEQFPTPWDAAQGVLPVFCEADPRSNYEVLDG